MNAVIDDWQPIDPTWNVQSALFYMEWFERSERQIDLIEQRPRLSADARIVHISGLPKPWQRPCGHPFEQPWTRALADSGYLSDHELAAWNAALTSDLAARGDSR